MANRKPDKVKQSKYKYVYYNRLGVKNMSKRWFAQMKGRSPIHFKTEKEAAKWVDFELIKLGLEPVNGFYTRKK